MTITADEAGLSAAELGAALRTARLRSHRSVSEIARRFRAGGDRVATANSYLYDAEKGRRLASAALVRAYAEVCDAPELLELRAGLDDSAPGAPARRADNRANPYDVLRRIEQRFGSDDAHANDHRAGLAREFPEPWASLATEYEPAAWSAASPEPIVCQGRLESSLMVARVLSWAARNDRITGDVVIVSSDGDALYDPSADVSVGHDASAGLLHGTMLFRCIVECLLSRGFNVVHVRPEAATPGGAQKQIEALVQLLGYRGEYIPKNLFSTRAEPPGTEPSHSILIPGVAAVQFMAANSPYCDSAVVIPAECAAQYDVLASTIEGTSRRRDPVASFVAAGSFNQGSSEQPQGTDLVQLLRAIRVIDTALEQLDAIPGERYALKDGLIAVTCPPSQLADRRRRFWKARKDESIEQVLPTQLDDIGAMTVRRRDAYIRNLSLYRHVDIVTKRSLERFVETGSFCDGDSKGVAFPDDYLGIELPTPHERVGHLQSLIADLSDYPNYELLLVEDDELPDLRGSGWAVKLKGQKPELAFFEAIRTRKRGRGGFAQSYAAWQVTQLPLIDQIARLAVDETERLREHCPPRPEVIAYLTDLIEQLERKHVADDRSR